MIKDLEPEDFNLLIKKNNTILIDVREPWEFDICKIQGAKNIPMNEIINNSELNQDDNLAIYCHHGVRSLKVIDFLESNGFKNLFNLKGGVDLWSLNIDNSITRY